MKRSICCLFGLFAFAIALGRIPVVIETDIGVYMDDSWALSLALADPSFDIRLVITSTNDTVSRARIVAKLLEAAGQDHVPIAAGDRTSSYAGPQAAWAKDYDLSKYRGGVTFDPVRSVIELLETQASQGMPLYLLELAPSIVFSEAAAARPDLFASSAVASTMGGSIAFGYRHKPGKVPEYNVKFNVTAAAGLFGTKFLVPNVVSPLDSSAVLTIVGGQYQSILEASRATPVRNPLLKALIESYFVWKEMCPSDPTGLYCDGGDPLHNSAMLFDVQAVALFSQSNDYSRFLKVTPMRLVVDKQGFTNEDPNGAICRVAIDWNDMDGFVSTLTQQYLNPSLKV